MKNLRNAITVIKLSTIGVIANDTKEFTQVQFCKLVTLYRQANVQRAVKMVNVKTAMPLFRAVVS